MFASVCPSGLFLVVVEFLQVLVIGLSLLMFQMFEVYTEAFIHSSAHKNGAHQNILSQLDKKPKGPYKLPFSKNGRPLQDKKITAEMHHGSVFYVPSHLKSSVKNSRAQA